MVGGWLGESGWGWCDGTERRWPQATVAHVVRSEVMMARERNPRSRALTVGNIQIVPETAHGSDLASSYGFLTFGLGAPCLH